MSMPHPPPFLNKGPPAKSQEINTLNTTHSIKCSKTITNMVSTRFHSNQRQHAAERPKPKDFSATYEEFPFQEDIHFLTKITKGSNK